MIIKNKYSKDSRNCIVHNYQYSVNVLYGNHKLKHGKRHLYQALLRIPQASQLSKF